MERNLLSVYCRTRHTNNIVFTNEKLFRFKMTDSPLCAFCETEVESPEHLFFHCDITKYSGSSFVPGFLNKK